MTNKSLFFIVNPGSASRKYALFADRKLIANIHFELVNEKVSGFVEYNGQKQSIDHDEPNLVTVSKNIMPLLLEYGVISESDKISGIGIRLVAPSRRFMSDELVTDEVEAALEYIQHLAPLHITTALTEIKQLRTHFSTVPIVAISDSAFHATKPEYAQYYGIDKDLADKMNIQRFGYHGTSVGSIIRYLTKHDMLMKKTIVCHLGSGSSVSAVVDGKSVDTTMGYSPLEGLVMSTRSGSIDVSAALAIKRELKLSDAELEKYLYKKSGLLGVSGVSDDIRELISSEKKGNLRAKLALDLFVYRIQQSIGQMAATMDGVNCLVFTGTVGERSAIIRSRVLSKLSYLGFSLDVDINNKTYEPSEAINIASTSSKAILVILTDESTELARRTEIYLK